MCGVVNKMKKCSLLFVIFVLAFLFSFETLAGDASADFVDVNGMIFLYSADGEIVERSDLFYTYDHLALRDSFDKMLTVLLHSSNVPDEHITFSNVQEWRAIIQLLQQIDGDFSFQIALEKLDSYLNLKNDGMMVGFSRDFLSLYAKYFDAFLDIVGLMDENYSLGIVSCDLSLPAWYKSAEAYIFSISSTMVGSKPAVERIYAYDVRFITFLENAEGEAKNLIYIWNYLRSFLNIPLMFSWLPGALSSVYITFVSLFFALSGVFIALKILHG